MKEPLVVPSSNPLVSIPCSVTAKVGVFLYHKDMMLFLWSRGGKNVEEQRP